MNPVSPYPVLASLAVALIGASLLVRLFGAPSSQGRFAPIDGLRGYLALFVFWHHAAVWYFYLQSDQWSEPPSNLYVHFGQSSVAVFFMITGFLFFSKLLDAKTRRIDWERLFLSRLLRLTPLYVLAILLLFVVVAMASDFQRREGISQLLSDAIRWLGFTIAGAPDLNGVAHTPIIVAGVTWSLAYEWVFYLCLPVLALAVGARPPRTYVGFGALAAAGAMASLWPLQLPLLSPFLGGFAAALVVRSVQIRSGLALPDQTGLEPAQPKSMLQIASNRWFSFLALACAGCAVAGYISAYRIVPMVLLSVAFAIVACGNDLFGILNWPASRMLGGISYGIYLLHGLVLFVTFRLALGTIDAKALSVPAYWSIVTIVVTPAILLVSFATYRWVESPCMRSTDAILDWIRARVRPVAQIRSD